ncbi:MAG: hypothetical protein KI790_19765 [Cyclobacteriaceae bacterium]|nr:hypothetical protein [Cyclobacteriaceae bacterium HetDA_MAG_MS6]
MKYLLPLTLIIISLNASAQDLIVKINGDSLNCRIVETKNRTVFFSVFEGQTPKSDFLSLDEIKTIHRGYYEENPDTYVAVTKDGEAVLVDADATKYGPAPKKGRLKTSLDIGWGFRTGQLVETNNSVLDEYLRQLKNGLSFGASMEIFINSQSSIGVKASQFQKKNSGDISGVGSISDNIRIRYIGPYYGMSNKLVSGPIFHYHFGLGYMSYYNDARDNGTVVVIEGETFGLEAALGIDIPVSQNMAIGFTAAFTAGTLTSLTRNGQTIKLQSDQYESLSRFDLTVGLRIY